MKHLYGSFFLIDHPLCHEPDFVQIFFLFILNQILFPEMLLITGSYLQE